MIELRNVHKTLAGREVLKGMSLRVDRGETLVIVGASGSGKSVTLKHMIGLMRPDKGEVLVDGRPVHDARGRELEAIRDQFGVLFQSGALINWMTVFDNVALPLRERTAMTEREIDERVREKLALVGLEGAEDKMPAALSGGMKKRAGLARALARNPSVILYDEPTSGLDPVLSRSIDQLISDVERQLKTTGVVVTHDLLSAFNVGDRIALLHDGEIVACGTPAEFREESHPVVQEFLHAHFSDAGRGPDGAASVRHTTSPGNQGDSV